jgi:hypothetical protein
MLDIISKFVSKLTEDEKTKLAYQLEGTSMELAEAQNQKLIEEFKKEKLKLQNNNKQQASYILNLETEKE